MYNYALTAEEVKALYSYEDGIKALDNEERTTGNGQRTMENATFFNLAGQRMQHPMRGVYIVNGKKIIVK